METPEEMYGNVMRMHFIAHRDVNIDDHYTKAIKLLNHYRSQVQLLRGVLYKIENEIDYKYGLQGEPEYSHTTNIEIKHEALMKKARSKLLSKVYRQVSCILTATEPTKWSE